jgi:putative selenate reductase
MRDASPWIDRLRAAIPKEFGAAREAAYPTRLSDSITLSTFHGCPAGEIEGITEYLIGEHDFDVIVKMNPPTLGRETLEHLLHDVLGYTELRINPKAYDAAISFDESVELCRRLTDFAAKRGRRVGFKFSNTLEVENQRTFFSPDNAIMYLSGQPLHVITMALTAKFREAVGPDVPISFSAGIDKQNFPIAVACGFVPVTMSTDLLRPGGYGRLPAYLEKLAEEMGRFGAGDIDEFVLRRFGRQDEAARRAGADRAAQVHWAGVLNTRIAADEAAADPRYHAAANRKAPNRIDSRLAIFDCITCDKCLPVCPNAANFTYPTPQVAFDYPDWLIDADGTVRPGETRRFVIDKPMQIACYADFCNECGNCDTFCPEYGGPYIEKPSFFGTVESWQRAAPRDGFVIEHDGGGSSIRGRLRQHAYVLSATKHGDYALFDGVIEVRFDAAGRPVNGVHANAPAGYRLDMWVFHTLRHLLHGVLDTRRVNQVNVAAPLAP